MCSSFIMLSAIMLGGVILSVVKLSVVVLSVMLDAVMRRYSECSYAVCCYSEFITYFLGKRAVMLGAITHTECRHTHCRYGDSRSAVQNRVIKRSFCCKKTENPLYLQLHKHPKEMYCSSKEPLLKGNIST